MHFTGVFTKKKMKPLRADHASQSVTQQRRLNCLSDFQETRYGSFFTKSWEARVSFVKIGSMTVKFYCGCNCISPLQFPFPSPIWTQFGTGDLHIMPWGGLTVKLTKLQSHSLAWVPSKVLGGSLAMSSRDHMFLKNLQN